MKAMHASGRHRRAFRRGFVRVRAGRRQAPRQREQCLRGVRRPRGRNRRQRRRRPAGGLRRGAARSRFERLVRRLTLPDELAAPAACPRPDGAALERLVLSVDVADERRSGTRYIGRLTVRFDPSGVRTLLRGAGSHRRRYAHRAGAGRAAVVEGVPPMRRPTLWREVGRKAASATNSCRSRSRRRRLHGAPDWRRAAPFAQARGRCHGALRHAARARLDRDARRWSKSTPTRAPRPRRSHGAHRGRGCRGLARGARVAWPIKRATRMQNEWKAPHRHRRRPARARLGVGALQQPSAVGADQGRAGRRGRDADLGNPHRSGGPRRRAGVVLVRRATAISLAAELARRGVRWTTARTGRCCASLPGDSWAAARASRACSSSAWASARPTRWW